MPAKRQNMSHQEHGVLYFGDPRGALALLERQVKVCGIVHGRKGGEGYRKLLTFLKNQNLKHIPRWQKPNLTDTKLVAEFLRLKPDLIISGFYPRQIPQEVLHIAPGFNVHPSDLPKWRGPDPAYWVIASGESETAICIHELTEGLDEGRIAHRVKLPVLPKESGGALARRLERDAAELLGQWVAKRYVLARTQNLSIKDLPLQLSEQIGQPSWAPLVSPDEVEIDWSKPAYKIDHLVRAASPDPGAFSAIDTGFHPELLVVYTGKVIKNDRLDTVPFGSPIIIKGECLIKCGEGAYQLGRIKVGRREMHGRDLARLLS